MSVRAPLSLLDQVRSLLLDVWEAGVGSDGCMQVVQLHGPLRQPSKATARKVYTRASSTQTCQSLIADTKREDKPCSASEICARADFSTSKSEPGIEWRAQERMWPQVPRVTLLL
jgi:hypothetical protein